MNLPPALEKAFSAAFKPLQGPTVGDGTVGTTSALLTADHPGSSLFNVRRVRLFNTSATQIVGVILAARGATATGGALADAIKIPAGQVWAGSVSDDHRLLVIADAAGATYNFMVDDI